MALEYYLRPFNPESHPGTWIAQAVTAGTIGMEAILDRMTGEGTTITTAEALANLELFTRTVRYFLRQGYAVNTPLVNFRPTIKGSFTGEEDTFDPKRHTRNIGARTGVELRNIAGAIPLRRIDPPGRQPNPRLYYDNHSGANNRLITPGKGARITGSDLKFDEGDTDQGVFFINTADNSVIQVEGRMLRNKPRELIFNNPGLTPGTYRLEVRSILNFTSEVRTGELSDTLTVDDGVQGLGSGKVTETD